MARKIRNGAFVLLLFSGILAMILEPTGAEAPLRPTMTRLAEALGGLLERSGSPLEWENLRNRAEIEKNLKALLAGSHELKGAAASGSEDPAISVLYPYLEREASITLTAYRIHQFEYSRMNFRNVVSTCIGCHSRDPEFQDLGTHVETAASKGLSALERARFFSATRNMDRALQEYHRALFEPGLAKRDLYTWERGFREAMTLLIRVKRSPGEASELVRKLRNANSVPYFLKRELQEWQQDLDGWISEKPRRPESETSLFTEIRRIFRKAAQKKRYPMDHSADALLLRLTSLSYEFLQRFPQSRNLPEIWYILGVAHATLDIPPFENLHDQFLEQCIRSRPHSTLALKCYSQLEQNVYMGFTGSSGTRIPDEVKSKLLGLWGLSFIPNPAER